MRLAIALAALVAILGCEKMEEGEYEALKARHRHIQETPADAWIPLGGEGCSIASTPMGWIRFCGELVTPPPMNPLQWDDEGATDGDTEEKDRSRKSMDPRPEAPSFWAAPRELDEGESPLFWRVEASTEAPAEERRERVEVDRGEHALQGSGGSGSEATSPSEGVEVRAFDALMDLAVLLLFAMPSIVLWDVLRARYAMGRSLSKEAAYAIDLLRFDSYNWNDYGYGYISHDSMDVTVATEGMIRGEILGRKGVLRDFERRQVAKALDAREESVRSIIGENVVGFRRVQ